MANNHERGGIWALAGFLYQIVGMLSMTAQVRRSNIIANDDLTEVSLFLTHVGEFVRARHEYLGQDVAFVNEADETVLVQFKYSSTSRSIDATELREIINNLTQGADLALTQGQNITACVLITNRNFTERGGGANQLWENESETQRGYNLRRFDIPLDTWRRHLKDYGRSVCASDHEILQGINQLIGRVVQQTGSQYPDVSVTIEDIKEAFTACRVTRQLTPENVSSHSLGRLNALRDRDPGLHIPVIRREVLDELNRYCAEGALVVLNGKGGCGKTVVAWQWLREHQFSAFWQTQDIIGGWISHEMCDWLGLPPQHLWRTTLAPNDAIGRIINANPNYPLPIIHLALDGIDEGFVTQDVQRSIRDIVGWFWDEDVAVKRGNGLPRAILIVTCRDVVEFERTWLPSSPSGFGSTYNLNSITLDVDVFSDDELLSALRAASSMDESISSKIEQALEAPSTLDTGLRSSPIFASTAPPMRPIDQSIVTALHHPVVWRAFLGLETENQLGVLYGTDESLMQLAERFVRRFCQKVLDRRRINELQEDELRMLLSGLASAQFPQRQEISWYSYQDWLQPLQTGSLNDIEIKRLYTEALSGGLIIQGQPKNWQWSYHWIREYLAIG